MTLSNYLITDMKNLIILQDDINITPLYSLFKELTNRGIEISLYSNNRKLCVLFKEINCTVNNLKFCQNFNSNLNALLFTLLIPFKLISTFTWLFFLSRKKNKPSIIYFGQSGQILLPFVASLLRLKLTIFRNPNNESYSKLTKKLIKLFSAKGVYWVLSNEEKKSLDSSLSKNAKIKILPLGISQYAENQDNIFSQMAKRQRTNQNKKFFSLGVVVTNKDNYLEFFFNACKNCLNVIKELQVMVICDINIKNKMQWLTKKLEIDSLVWFVGKETLRRKWCDNLDIYTSINTNFSLQCYYHLLSAQANHVPIIAPNNNVYAEIIENNKSGLLINMKDSEELSQTIINLYRDRILRKKIEKRAIEIINEKHKLNEIVEKFIIEFINHKFD
jgi:glycosyltransferase involved in cell wall biosynthesis